MHFTYGCERSRGGPILTLPPNPFSKAAIRYCPVQPQAILKLARPRLSQHHVGLGWCVRLTQVLTHSLGNDIESASAIRVSKPPKALPLSKCLTARLKAVGEMITCPNCKGKGQIKGPKWLQPVNWALKTCPTCGGTRRVADYQGRWVRCPVCLGWGIEPPVWLDSTCYKCRGVGILPSGRA